MLAPFRDCPDIPDLDLANDAVLSNEACYETFVRLLALFRWTHAESHDECLPSDLAAFGSA